jgi:hypothetical protein
VLLRGLGGRVRIVAAERVALGVRVRPGRVALVARDDDDRLRGACGARRVEHVRRPQDVRLEGLRRRGERPPHERLGGEVEHHLRAHPGDRLVDRARVAHVGAVRRGELVDPGEREERGLGRDPVAQPVDLRAEDVEPEREPRALEAGVPGDEHAPPAPAVRVGQPVGHGAAW